MVGSIASISLVSGSTATSASTSSSDLATQLTAKQQALAAARTADERKSLQAEIDALKVQIEAQSSSGPGTGSEAAGRSSGSDRPPPPPPPPQGNTANVGTRNFDSSTPFGNRQMYV